MPKFFETLESRTFLSAAPLTMGIPLLASSATLVQPVVAPVSVQGAYSGSISVTGIHAQPVTLTLRKRAVPAKFVGTLVATQDPTIQVRTVVKVTGRAANGKRFITISFGGTHSNGAIVGTGSGIITPAGNLRVLNFSFIQNGQSFPGTVVLMKAA